MGVVGHELDVERGPRRDDWRRSDVAAVLPQQVGRVGIPVVDLDVVVPGWERKDERRQDKKLQPAAVD